MLETLLDDVNALMAAHIGAALAIVFAFAALEATFVVGVVVPGFVVLAAAGALVGAGKLPVAEVMVTAAAGAFTGAVVSYGLGRLYAGRLRSIRPFAGYGTLVVRGEDFFRRYGVASVFVGHFVPGVKAVMPAVAGMMGMGIVPFVLVAAVAAVASACAILLPAIGLGMGLGGIGSADPRLIALLVLAALVAFIAWRLARVVAGRLLPALLAVARQGSSRAVARGWPGAGVVDAVLNDRGGILAPILWAAAAALAILGFVRITLDVTLGTRMAVADQAMSNFVQAFRSPPVDALMVAVTMVGDGVMLTAVTLALMAVLAIARDWRAMATAGMTIGLAALSVPFIKSMLQRGRPMDLYDGNHAFSFPSGHASLSMAVIGVVAVVIARALRPKWRPAVYGFAAVAAALVAFSRVYLGVHWPSDVVAGLMFGAIVVSAFALALGRRRLAVRPALVAAIVGLTFVSAYAVHLRTGHADWIEAYARTDAPVTLSRSDWLAGGWRTVPVRRIELGGETGEPVTLQTDLPAAVLGRSLAGEGWTIVEAGPLALMAALPASAPLERRKPLPLFHDGRAPALVAVGPVRDGTRPVIRLWPTGRVTGPDRPILAGSILAERLGETVLGLSRLEDRPADEAMLASARARIGAIAGTITTRPGGPDGPLLLTEATVPDPPAAAAERSGAAVRP